MDYARRFQFRYSYIQLFLLLTKEQIFRWRKLFQLFAFKKNSYQYRTFMILIEHLFFLTTTIPAALPISSSVVSLSRC